MSLGVGKIRQRLVKGVGIALLLLFVGALGLLLYNEKYLSEHIPERIPPVYAESDDDFVVQEVDEKPVTEKEIAEYVVASGRPRYISIAKLGVKNARVIEIGVETNSKGKKRIGTPANVFDVGWWNGSSLPGSGGAMLMDGHNGGPNVDGVFKRLDSLVAGDEIVVEVGGSGKKLTYLVVENKILPLSSANEYMDEMTKSAVSGKEGLNLITCTGEWIASKQTYASRAMVRAVRK